MTTTPAATANFISWSGACTGSATTCTVTMDAAKSVIANFSGVTTTTTTSLPTTTTTVRPTTTTTSTAVSTTTTTASVPTTTVVSKTYTDNHDGTVTDSTTGLVWMRCAMGMVWDGKTCTGTASTYTFDQANALTGTTTFAGQSDWRMPNIRELQTVVDRSVYNTSIDKVAFPNTSPWRFFWSASANSGLSSNAWGVSFGNGSAGNYDRSSAFPVRLVRAGQSSNLLKVSRPSSDYVDHADGTVTHTPTGLIWQKCAVGQSWNTPTSTCTGTALTTTWDAALKLTSSLAGRTDWRLPTEDELGSLVDYGKSSPAINTSIFSTESASNFWSASALFGFPIYAWYVDFNYGFAYYDKSSSSFQVRLVRANTLVTTSSSTAATTTSTVNTTTTTTQGGTGQTLTLSPGWNLLGNGTDQPLTMTMLAGDKASSVTTVWKWDVAQTGWQFYAPSMDATALQTYATNKNYGVLSQVNAGEGFWVNAAKAFSMTLPGSTTISASDFQDGKPSALKKGWNLVAIGNALMPSALNMALSASPPTTGVVPINLTTLWAWDNLQAKWYFYAPSLEALGGTALTDYIVNKGYLDFTAANRLLWPGTGFWVNKP